MPRKTTVTLEQYKELLYNFFQMNKRMPTYQEACEVFSVKSKDTAYRIIQKITLTGFVSIDDSGKIIPSTAFNKASANGLKVLGLVEAGFPTPAEEDLNAETISLDEWIINRREASFMLKVKGDSMYDAGIRDGDMVIVERGLTPKVGEIVIARTEDGWTMKYLKKKSGKNGAFYLEPANADYPNIEPHEILEIAAVVKGIVRKY